MPAIPMVHTYRYKKIYKSYEKGERGPKSRWLVVSVGRIKAAARTWYPL